MKSLAASLSHARALGRAGLVLRERMDRVVVTWGEAVRRHSVEIEGRLGALLELGGAHAVAISPADRPDVEAAPIGRLDADAGPGVPAMAAPR